MAFDPDAYLAQSNAEPDEPVPQTFDPDAYLAQPGAPVGAVPEVPQLRAVPEEGMVSRAVRTVREGLSPLIGPTENQRLAREQNALQVANMLPAISRHVEAQRPNLVEQEGFVPAMFTPSEEAPLLIPRMEGEGGGLAAVGRGLVNTGTGVINSMTSSPGGLLTLGVGTGLAPAMRAGGAAAPAARTAVIGSEVAFGADQARQVVEGFGPTVQAAKDLAAGRGDVQQNVEQLAGQAVNAFTLGLAGGDAARRTLREPIERQATAGPRITNTPPVDITPVVAKDAAPLAPEAAPALLPGERAPGTPSPLEVAPTAMEAMRAEAVAGLPPEYRSVVEKYPALMAMEGLEDGSHIPVEIRHADGTTEGAVMNGYGDAMAADYGEPGQFTTKPSIGYYKPEAGGFSHTPIRPGDTIISKVPTPQEWAQRQMVAEPALLDPSPAWLSRARETAEQVINVPATLRAIENLGKTSPDAAVDMIGQMHRQIGERNEARRLLAPTDRVRGPDYVKERLLRARRTGELPEGTASFGLWLLEKNPGIADSLGIAVRASGAEARAAGSYTPGDRLVTLFTDTANPGTAVHEILHHSERLMPKPVQEGILTEWSSAAKREIERSSEQRAAALIDFMAATQTGDQAAWNRANAAMGKGILKPGDYQFTNPSEWWAVNGTKILSARYGADGWVAAARQWLAELIDRARGFFGGKTNAAVIAGLRGVMDGTYQGEPPRNAQMLSRQMARYMDPAQPLKPLPEEAIVVPLGKREQVLQGVGGEEQWQVRLPGEIGRGRTVTAAALAEMGYLPPEPQVELSIGGGEASAVPVSQLPGAIQAALYDAPIGPRTPAMTAVAMDQGGAPGGPISPTAIANPSGPPAPGSTPLRLLESAKKAPGTREELRQSLGANAGTITIPEVEARAKQMIDTFENLDAARAFVMDDKSGTPLANAMAIELFNKFQTENRLQDAGDVINNFALKARTQGQAVRMLAELSKSTPAGMAVYASKLFGRALTSGEIGEINAAMKRINAATDSEVRVSRLLALLDRINARSPMRAKWDDKAASILNIAMLLNTKTVTRNVVGNMILATANLGADMIVPAFDAGISVRTGERSARGAQMAEYFRGLATPGVDLMKGYKQARSEGAARWPSFKEGMTVMKDMAKLISSGHLSTGELMNSYRTTFAGWTPDGKRGPLRRGASSMLRGLENSLTVTMGTFDRAFYEARRRASLKDMMDAADAKAPTVDMVDRSLTEAATAIYQNENFLSESLRDLKRGANRGSTIGLSTKIGLGSVVANFVQVPGSLLLEGMKFTPLGFVKPLSHAMGALFLKRQFNQREFAQEMTKAFMGTTGLVGAGAWLNSLGIISGPKEEDPKIRALQRSLGFGAYQINVSALKRAYQSLDWRTRQPRLEGDVFYTYDWAQPVALPVAMGANVMEFMRRSKMQGDVMGAQDVPDAFIAGLLGGARSLEEQPLLAGLTGFMQEVADSRHQGKGLIDALFDSMAKLPGQFLPTTIRQVQQLMDNRVYETRGTDKMETAYQATLANIPGMAQALGYKPRADILGDLAERYQANGNTFFNVLVNPGFVTRMKDDPELRELYGIWETTGSTGQIPGAVDKKVTINGQPKVLTASERADYQQFVGRITRDVFKQIMRSEGYQAADDAVRAKVLAQIVSAANTVAKVRLFGDKPRRVDKYDRALYGASVLNPDAQALVPAVR